MENNPMQSDNTEVSRWQSIKKRVTPRNALSAGILAAAVAFPGAVYADAQHSDTVGEMNGRLHQTLDNETAKKMLGVALIAGVPLTLQAHYTGKKYDERRLHTLRTAGPALLTAATGAALVDSQIEIPAAIPAGLLWAGANAQALTGVISTHERTPDRTERLTSIATGGGFVSTAGATLLAIADKI